MGRVIGFLRERIGERSFWAGLFLFVVSVAAFWFWRHELFALISAGMSAVVGWTPNRILVRGFERQAEKVFEEGRGVLPEIDFEKYRNFSPMVFTKAPKESGVASIGGLVTAVEDAGLSAVENFFLTAPLSQNQKVAVNAVIQAYKTRSVANIVTAIEDVMNVIEDMEKQISASNMVQQMASNTSVQQ